MLETIGVPEHSLHELAHGLDRVGRVTQLGERGQRRAAQALRLLDDAFRRLDCPAPEPALDEVHGPPLEPRERRAEESEEVAAGASRPREAQQRRERVHERRLREAQLAIDGIRDAQRAEHRLERAADPVVAGHDETDPIRRHAAAGEREHLLAHQLERAAAPGALEEADHPVERRRLSGLVREEPPFEMRERRGRHRLVARRQLLDRAGSQTGEILGRPPQCREDRPSRLVGKRDGDLGPSGQRLEQGPLRTGEVLEAVREDRLAVPGVELGPETLDGVTAQQAAIPAPEPVELVSVPRVEGPELALHRVRREEPLVELLERPLERFCEARMRGGACVAVELRAAHDPADEERLLQASELPASFRRSGSEPAKEVVERADRAAQQRRTPGQQLELDAVDVRPVRHDEHRLEPVPGVEHVEIAVEQELDLARVGRARDEAERHPPTLARARDGL